MGDSWQFRSIQPNVHPPPFAFNAAEPNPPPFHHPIQNPQFLDHRPVRDPHPHPHPLPPPFHPPNDRFAQDESLDRDGYRKRMRVEDPHLLLPHPRFSMDDQWRLDMIREHGRQDSHVQANELDGHGNFQEFLRMAPERFNPMLVRQNQHMQVNEFDGHQNFRHYSRFESERREFYGGEDGNFRAGAFGSRSGSTWSRTEENCIGRVSDERPFHDFRPPITSDWKFNSNEGQSYMLPKETQYPHPESNHMVPRIVSYEQESYYPPSLQPHLESSIETQYQQGHPVESKPPHFEDTRKPCEPHINFMPYGNNDYRIDSAMMVRVHASQTYPSLSSHPPLPPNDYRKNPYPPPLEDKIELENQQRTPFDEVRNPFEPYSMPFGTSDYGMGSVGIGRAHTSEMYHPLPSHPPLPPLPPPSPPPHCQEKPVVPTPPPMMSAVPATTSAPLFPFTLCSQSSMDSCPTVQFNLHKEAVHCTSTGFVTEGLVFINQTPSKEFMEGRGQKFPPPPSLEDKATVIDAHHLFRQPHRASRPDHVVIILRGLPGSGKSYLAKALRDLEVESGGNAPRIHSMDDYFMIEVEKKIEDSEGYKSSGSSRGKKQITKKVIEYCYEPEMEEAYRSSMLKAFKKTLDEGNFTFIIVFAGGHGENSLCRIISENYPMRSGYEVYLLEAVYKDPTGCAARNVHGFTVEDIQKMAEQWEEAPSLYLRLDIQSLFRGDDLDEQSIQEVDMDTDDAGGDEVETLKVQRSESMDIVDAKAVDQKLDGFVKIGERWNADDNEEDELTRVKDLGSSKWSKDVDEDIDNSASAGGTSNALSGLIQAYGKSEKSVHWGDQVKLSGFSIGAVKKQSRSSLIIGPGSGYNLKSNPLQEDEDDALQQTIKSSIIESKRKFTEQLRAERESFKAVFDRRRRQRIGGLWDAEDE